MSLGRPLGQFLIYVYISANTIVTLFIPFSCLLWCHALLGILCFTHSLLALLFSFLLASFMFLPSFAFFMTSSSLLVSIITSLMVHFQVCVSVPDSHTFFCSQIFRLFFLDVLVSHEHIPECLVKNGILPLSNYSLLCMFCVISHSSFSFLYFSLDALRLFQSSLS